MQDPQNARPRLARFQTLYRTVFDQPPHIIPHTARSTCGYQSPPAFPQLGIQQAVQLVHDPTIPTCLIRGLDRYAQGLQEDRLEDEALEIADGMLRIARRRIPQQRLRMESGVSGPFFAAVSEPVTSLCQSIGLDVSYRDGPTVENVHPDFGWWSGDGLDNLLAVFEHESPSVADHHFSGIIERSQNPAPLNLGTAAKDAESILAKLILVSVLRGLNFAAVLSLKDFIFLCLVQLDTGQWQARISDIIPLTSQETPIVSVVLALVLHSRNDGLALQYLTLEEEAAMDLVDVGPEPAEGPNLGPPGAGPQAPTKGPPTGHNIGGQMPGPNMLAVSEYWEPSELSEDALASLLNTMDGVSMYWDMKPFSEKIFRPVRREDSSLWGRSLPSTAIPRIVTHSHPDHSITTPPSPPMTPFVLRLNSVVGRGSTGTAYQGCFLDHPLRLVVKTLPSDRMDRELEIWRQLRHLAGTSIPGLFGAYAIEGVEGFSDTGALVQQHGGSALSSFDVLTQNQRTELYRIVTGMHEAGVEHGDLIPTNVTLNKDGRVMVIDFSPSCPHKCTGGTCQELRYLREELGLQG